MFNNEEVNTYNRSIVLWEQAAHTTQEGQLSVTRDSNLNKNGFSLLNLSQVSGICKTLYEE